MQVDLTWLERVKLVLGWQLLWSMYPDMPRGSTIAFGVTRVPGSTMAFGHIRVPRLEVLGEQCGCTAEGSTKRCTRKAVIPVKVPTQNGRIGTVYACADHAEALIQQIEAGEHLV